MPDPASTLRTCRSPRAGPAGAGASGDGQWDMDGQPDRPRGLVMGAWRLAGLGFPSPGHDLPDATWASARPPSRWMAGADRSARTLLEVALHRRPARRSGDAGALALGRRQSALARCAWPQSPGRGGQRECEASTFTATSPRARHRRQSRGRHPSVLISSASTADGAWSCAGARFGSRPAGRYFSGAQPSASSPIAVAARCSRSDAECRRSSPPKPTAAHRAGQYALRQQAGAGGGQAAERPDDGRQACLRRRGPGRPCAELRPSACKPANQPPQRPPRLLPLALAALLVAPPATPTQAPTGAAGNAQRGAEFFEAGIRRV